MDINKILNKTKDTITGKNRETMASFQVGGPSETTQKSKEVLEEEAKLRKRDSIEFQNLATWLYRHEPEIYTKNTNTYKTDAGTFHGRTAAAALEAIEKMDVERYQAFSKGVRWQTRCKKAEDLCKELNDRCEELEARCRRLEVICRQWDASSRELEARLREAEDRIVRWQNSYRDV